jgi:hypothetical protein
VPSDSGMPVPPQLSLASVKRGPAGPAKQPLRPLRNA